MRVSVHETPDEAARAAAGVIAGTLRAKPGAVLGLATGGTMEPVYEALIEAHLAGLSFAKATSFNLDEYVGLGPEHPQSYRRYIEERFLRHVGIDPARAHVPRGDVDPGEAARRYEALLDGAERVDLQLLGLGRNGHIGFNEPGSPFDSRTREVALSTSTIRANARFFGAGETPPERAVTMGIGTILRARRILLLACGAAKAKAVRATLEGPVSEAVPATALRSHPSVTVILDAAAAALLGPDGRASAA